MSEEWKIRATALDGARGEWKADCAAAAIQQYHSAADSHINRWAGVFAPDGSSHQWNNPLFLEPVLALLRYVSRCNFQEIKPLSDRNLTEEENVYWKVAEKEGLIYFIGSRWQLSWRAVTAIKATAGGEGGQ